MISLICAYLGGNFSQIEKLQEGQLVKDQEAEVRDGLLERVAQEDKALQFRKLLEVREQEGAGLRRVVIDFVVGQVEYSYFL